MTVKQAKDYLAHRIGAEAVRQGISLSETERKMLYFSETDWTLPDMKQVSELFDRVYDQNQYEQKIASLVREITSYDHSHSRTDAEAWDDAVEKLSDGDHYLSVLVTVPTASTPGLHGFLPTFGRISARPPHDKLKLWTTGFVLVFATLSLVAIGNWLLGSKFWAALDWIFDRHHSGLILIPIAIWFLWLVRDDLKIVLKGLIKRP